MSEHEKIEKISKLEGSRRKEGLSETDYVERVAPNKESFDALLNQDAAKVRGEVSDATVKRSALIAEVGDVTNRVDSFNRKSPEEILAQTKSVIAEIDTIKQKLRTPDLKIEPSVQTLMQSKLNHIDDKLRVAVEKVGGEYTTLETREARASLRNPIERFLASMEDSESQLQNIGKTVMALGNDREHLSPATLLMLQVKVGFVQQELEFFTSLLNKSLESTKTLMNVQV